MAAKMPSPLALRPSKFERVEGMPKRTVGLRCTICLHPTRPQIDLAIATRLSKRAIAQRFAVSPDAVWRHSQAHLTVEVRSALTTKLLQREGDMRCMLLDEGAVVIEAFLVRLLKNELEARGIKSKSWTTASGRRVGGKPFSRGALYLMLQNRLYRGEIVHKGQSHPGEHTPVIDQPRPLPSRPDRCEPVSPCACPPSEAPAPFAGRR